jgi:hypothetical protein
LVLQAPKKEKAPAPSSKPAKSGGGKQKKKVKSTQTFFYIHTYVHIDANVVFLWYSSSVLLFWWIFGRDEKWVFILFVYLCLIWCGAEVEQGKAEGEGEQHGPVRPGNL